MSETPYIASLRAVFKKLHNCETKHLETVPVIERFQGKTVWEGEVEIFELIGHPRATKGYGWAYNKPHGSETLAVLELPPVISPKTAVQAGIMSQIKSVAKN